ncbi:hypothetical protein [Candidatus Poriferisodalis sp.]|uniref:hypothetical protein n=1 Tax=Candidatus Poriferisodalis sp. TaxID=3101277 RepID=UPI003B02D142
MPLQASLVDTGVFSCPTRRRAQALVDTLLDHRARRNGKGVLAAGSRLSYASNLKVFCEWASAERPQSPPIRAVPVCEGPEFVTDPGIDLAHLLRTQPIRVLQPDSS